MREYYVMKSKWKAENGHYYNELTYSPKTTLAKSTDGIYRYYHKGNLIWEEKADNKLYMDCLDDTFYNNEWDENLGIYPIFKKYADSTDVYDELD